MNLIDLRKLQDRLSGITPAVAQFYYEAATYALKICNHKEQVYLKIYGTIEKSVAIIWKDNFEKNRKNSWADEEELVEYGAKAIALLVIELLTPFTEFQRSPKGTGADFWLGKINEDGFFEYTALLEVSGIKQETSSNRVNTRINQKIKRFETLKTHQIPFYILVIEFSSPKAKFVTNEK